MGVVNWKMHLELRFLLKCSFYVELICDEWGFLIPCGESDSWLNLGKLFTSATCSSFPNKNHFT